VTSATASRFTGKGFVPYERDGRIARDAGINHATPNADHRDFAGRWTGRMNDTSRVPEPNGSAITLRNVNLSLGRGAARVHILKDVSLNIGRGQAVGLIGPSGSGKSTLLMVMAGLERPDAGSVAVAGHDLAALDEDALARFRGREVGIVFQSFHLIPTMTAIENVAVPLELAGHADAFERAERELASVGLADRLSHYPAQLSGGEQQRVALARALAPHPSILVADEPTGNLDEDTGRQIVDLLFAGHAERNTTLVLVTHDSSLAARCDRVVRMRSGHVETVSPDRVAS
jgi:putative ABC transport system ATP-binding protein